MKHQLLLLVALVALVCLPARADFLVDGNYYHVDTIIHRQIGPGIVNTVIRLPDFSLNVYVVSVDLNNPNNRVETTTAYNTLGRTELLSNAVVRNRTATKRPVAACNANFWVTSGSGAPFSSFEVGTPMGGVVRSGASVVNDNNTYDLWEGGPTRSGVASISTDKILTFGRMMWSGSINAAKLEQPLPYHNINRRAVQGEICLWTPDFTRSRQFEDDWVGMYERGNNHSDNYYLMLAPGQEWKTGVPMTFTVANIVYDADRQKLGNYDACLTVTGDANKTAMAALAVGDEIEVTSGWQTLAEDGPVVLPEIDNLVTGNAAIMINGQLTGRNYDETYNSGIYSRTCYGASADGKHLYLMVIDKSNSPLYGMSWGCPTSCACEILQQMCPDVYNIVNMDAGGSAEMLVLGSIINTTTENNPRGVACGWMVEAIGEEDNEVDSIAFDLFRIDIPAYAMTCPRVLGYNKIGELVDEDVKGFTLSCDASLGTAGGDIFVADGTETLGTLTATLGGMTATVPVRVLEAEPAILLKPLLIDNRDYPIEVMSSVVFNDYNFDPAMVDWAMDDNGVATITDGVLRGENNGTAMLTASIGSYRDTTEVMVEISPEAYLQQTWDGWTFKGAGAKDIVLDEATGNITFTYSSNRSPYLQMSKDLTLYSLPDTVAITFNSTMNIDYVQIDARNRYFPTSNFLRIDPADGVGVFEAGVDHTLLLDLEALGGADYVGTFPVSIKSIKFTLNKNEEAGDQLLAIKSFYCHYPNTQAVQGKVGDVNADDEVNIADVNALIDIILSGESGNERADVNGDGEVNIADINAVIDLILSK